MKTNPNAKPFEKYFGLSTPSKTAGLAFSIATILLVVISFLFSVVLTTAGLEAESVGNPDWLLYLSYILPQLAFALTIWFALAYQGVAVKTAVRSQKCHWKYFIIALVLQAGLMSLSQLNDWFLQLLGGIGYQDQGMAIPSLDGFGVVGVILVVALLPAVFEEVFFRGVLLGGLRSYKTYAVVLLSGALFALYHQNPAQTLYQFCCGCAFALMAIRAGSVLPTILAHFLNNATIILLARFGITAFSPTATWILMPIFGVCLLLSLIYLIFIDKNTPENDESDGAKKSFFTSASIGIGICALIWITTLVSGL